VRRIPGNGILIDFERAGSKKADSVIPRSAAIHVNPNALRTPVLNHHRSMRRVARNRPTPRPSTAQQRFVDAEAVGYAIVKLTVTVRIASKPIGA
jgi:hypothetical protein